MNRVSAVPLLFALVAASPAAPTVQVATGDWSKLPPLELISYQHLSSAIMSEVYEIGHQHRCRLPGQKGGHLDLSISFAAQLDPQGKLVRLLLPNLNCPEAEAWLGGTLVKSIQNGDYRPDAKAPNPEGWYRGDFSFYYEG